MSPDNCTKKRNNAFCAYPREQALPQIQRIIACEVFRPALQHLQLPARHINLCLSYLPSYLHLHPQKLKTQLLKKIITAKMRKERVLCLYGNCFPGIEQFCARYNSLKTAGAHCFELLLGSARFEKLINEEAGTYFVESDLIVNFETYCLQPLELYDDEMRRFFFANYKRLVYVRQPSDPKLSAKVRQLADFLELSLEIVDTDYTHLEREISKLI